jgi:cytochrome c peroxidase
MIGRKQVWAVVIATVLAALTLGGAAATQGSVGATEAVSADVANPEVADISVPVAQMENESSNDTENLPVEPPTDRALPTYEEVKKPGDTEAKVELGKMLYHDPRISETGSISCNSCHNVMEGGDGSRTVGRGVHGQTGPRNSPVVWNSVFMSTQFWDGRAATLEEQAKGPITASVEMGMPSPEAAMDRVRSVPGYVERYEEVYGGENPVTINNTVDAIAAYERTLITPNSPYDQYVRGDADALTEEQLEGMETFKNLGCQSCHSGPAFNGPQWQLEPGTGYFQKVGVYEDSEQCSEYIDRYNLHEDSGRAGVTGEESDEHMFKVPTLRNTADTAPYMHNGQVRTLENATKMMASCQLDQDISDEQAQELVAFMESLSGEYPEQTMPRLPSRSGGSPMIPADAGEASAPDDDGGAQVGTPEPTATPTSSSDSGAGDDTDTEAATDTPGSSGPGFTLAVMVAALLVALAMIGLKRRS